MAKFPERPFRLAVNLFMAGIRSVSKQQQFSNKWQVVQPLVCWLTAFLFCLLAACSKSPTGQPLSPPRLAGKSRITALPARPTFEESYPVAHAVAEADASQSLALEYADGGGVGKDGRVLPDAELTALLARYPSHTKKFMVPAGWHFTFVPPNDRQLADWHQHYRVAVAATGEITHDTYSVKHSGNSPDRQLNFTNALTVSQAVAQAVADGIPGQAFEVNFGYPTIYEGPGAFRGPLELDVADLARWDANGRGSDGSLRTILLRERRLKRDPTPQELDEVRSTWEAIARYWFKNLTGSLERPITPELLARARLTPVINQFTMRLYDRNSDGYIPLAEFLEVMLNAYYLSSFREITIKTQFWRADTDDDEKLTEQEAAGATLVIVSPKNQEAKSWPLHISQSDFQQADRNGDRLLDANEYVPLGARKSLQLLELRPDLLQDQVLSWIAAPLPWAH
ncbi:MAG: hypothetical protein HY692_00170 [Cyanobacteria bacterium NC_groundwater_1444_Ag_S-0.65um_54_12]|nr:hypothetical protein [Cyanobacteria bacterium NC_groundwater_1444_Ag_S-0.65um_54_12]